MFWFGLKISVVLNRFKFVSGDKSSLSEDKLEPRFVQSKVLVFNFYLFFANLTHAKMSSLFVRFMEIYEGVKRKPIDFLFQILWSDNSAF